MLSFFFFTFTPFSGWTLLSNNLKQENSLEKHRCSRFLKLLQMTEIIEPQLCWRQRDEACLASAKPSAISWSPEPFQVVHNLVNPASVQPDMQMRCLCWEGFSRFFTGSNSDGMLCLTAVGAETKATVAQPLSPTSAAQSCSLVL